MGDVTHRIVAGNYEQARMFAEEQGFLRTEWSYVSSREKIMGLLPENNRLHFAGTYYEHPEFHDIHRYALARGFLERPV